MSIRWLRLVYFENIFDTEWQPLQEQQQYNRSRSFEGPRSSPPSHGSHHFGGSLSPLGMTCLSEWPWLMLIVSSYSLIDVNCPNQTILWFFDSQGSSYDQQSAAVSPPHSLASFTSQVTWLLFLIGHITLFDVLVIDTRNEKSISYVCQIIRLYFWILI